MSLHVACMLKHVVLQLNPYTHYKLSVLNPKDCCCSTYVCTYDLCTYVCMYVCTALPKCACTFSLTLPYTYVRTSQLYCPPSLALLPVLTCSEASSMETAYRMVQSDSEGLQSRLHALEDELKTVKRELKEARDLLTEEADIEPGRPRTESVSCVNAVSVVLLTVPSCSKGKTSVG